MPRPASRPTRTASSGGRRAPCSATAKRCCCCWRRASCCSASIMAVFSPRFADTAVTRRGPCRIQPPRQRRTQRSAAARGKQALRRKEFRLLRRDPWLMSQTLMQLLYLVPPALLPVAQLLRQLHRDRADHARDRDGGGPARGRPRLADDLGRGRRRSGRDRAAAAVARDPRQDRGGADRDRRGVRAAGRGARHCSRRCRPPSPRPASCSARHRRPRSSSGSACRPSAASSAAARPRRGLRPSRKPSPRSAGPRPPRWRWPFPTAAARQRADDIGDRRRDLEAQPEAGLSLTPSPAPSPPPRTLPALPAADCGRRAGSRDGRGGR